MKTYLVGCGKQANIILQDPEQSISRLHLEITEDRDGKYYLTDCNSTNGTYRQRQGQWSRFQQDYVTLEEPLLLGRYQTTLRQLLAQRFDSLVKMRLPMTTPKKDRRASFLGLVERNPETGEIIPRRL